MEKCLKISVGMVGEVWFWFWRWCREDFVQVWCCLCYGG